MKNTLSKLFILLLTSLIMTSCFEESEKSSKPTSSPSITAYKENSLCTGEEKIYFSCSIKSKTLSICASKNLTKTSGYLKYRFGKPNKIELTYPATDINPLDAFKFNHYSRGGGKVNLAMNDDRLMFANNKSSYEVFQSYHSESEDKNNDGKSSGVSILFPSPEGGNDTITLKCEETTTEGLTELYFKVFN